MFRERAELYDLIYHWKNYAAEAARVRAMLTVAGVPDGSRLVEAACGTGAYLVHLAKWYDVEGFDLNAEMAAIASRKVPAARVGVRDMTDFALDRPADALVCLFSSHGYVHPERRPAAAACFFRALRPGGVAIVEPWLTPAEYVAGHVGVTEWDGEKQSPAVKKRVIRAGPHLVEGRRSVLDFHWLVVTPDSIEHFTDRHELWMETEEELTATFRGAGFDVTWLQPGPLTGRAVLVLRRPA
jgi:daunosaminyl-N,N-dimethyltransferase/N-dimethyltransferase